MLAWWREKLRTIKKHRSCTLLDVLTTIRGYFNQQLRKKILSMAFLIERVRTKIKQY